MPLNEALETKSKVCPRCGVTKLSVEFYRNRAKASGLQCWCKECCRVIPRKRREPQEQRDARLILTEEQRFVVARFVRRGCFPFPGSRNEYGNTVQLLVALNAIRYRIGQPVLLAAFQHAKLIQPQIMSQLARSPLPQAVAGSGREGS